MLYKSLALALSLQSANGLTFPARAGPVNMQMAPAIGETVRGGVVLLTSMFNHLHHKAL